ncbi:MAG: hypothetical protein ABSA45_00510 [Verrucomicrobiota bacterium]|jgi:hypothetical protein
MKEWIAFLLPPATALAGMRMSRLVLGAKLEEQLGFGLRFALGLALGMLVFSQAVLLSALAGINLSGPLAWGALIWGIVEIAWLAPKLAAGLRQPKFQPGHLWLLLLLPVLYSWWVFGRLCTLEGTLEFDANAFWVFKAKILYLEQGKNLLNVLHQTSLAYAHIDYPMLVPCLYTFDYGAVGGVDEFVNKVWPFWMVVALCAAILSLARVWRRPHPLPVLLVVLFCFLPGSLQFIRQEGATMPLLFFASLSALLIFTALCRSESLYLAAGVLVLAGSAATKYEGVIYSAVWFFVLLPIILRRGWLKKTALWKAAGIGILCLLPYVIYRLAHPVAHLADTWWKEGVSAPGTMLHRFPKMWFLNIFCRFFSPDFFNWSGDANGNIHWTGHWTGFGGLVNPDLSVLPWLLLLLLALSLWRKPGRGRRAIVYLGLAIIGVLTALTVVTTCFMSLQAGEGFRSFGELMIDFSGANEVGRYFFPLMVAWFLAVASIWFDDPQPSLAANAPNSARDNPLPGGATPSKKRR